MTSKASITRHYRLLALQRVEEAKSKRDALRRVVLTQPYDEGVLEHLRRLEVACAYAIKAAGALYAESYHAVTASPDFTPLHGLTYTSS